MFYTLPAKISQYIDQFTGRAWLLPKILDWYENSYDRLLLITGDPGTGKSMMAAWLAGSGPTPEDPPADTTLPDHLLFNGMLPSQQLAFLRSQKGAIHFCQAEGGSVQPSDLAKNLANQLVRIIPGFDEDLRAFLSERVVLNVEQNIGTVAPGGKNTGIYIKDLNIKDLNDQTRFSRTVREPIINLYNRGYTEKMLIIVDSLDEALSYNGEPKIHNLLAQLSDLPYQVHVLATTRPDPRILKEFFQVPTLDLVESAPPDTEDVRAYAYARLPASLGGQKRNSLAQQIGMASKGIFLYGRLVVEELLEDLMDSSLEKEIDFPTGLPGFYNRFLERELGKDISTWEKSYKPVLGVVSVAQDEGLRSDQMGKITRQNVQEILFACLQYLDGNYPKGPYRVFHRSFADYLLESSENSYYHIDAASMHALITDYYYDPDRGAWPFSKWDDYAQKNITVHLEGASQLEDEKERHTQVERLAQLVQDPMFQKRFRKKVNDESRMKHMILSAMRAASGDTCEEALELLLRTIRLFQTHRHEWLQPGPVFNRAENGDPVNAIDQLLAFPLEDQWQRAAALVMAWLAAKKTPEKAADILRLSESRPDRSILEIRLADRLRSILENSPVVLENLPGAPSRDLVDLLLLRLGGQKEGEELIGNITSGYDLHPNPQIATVLGELINFSPSPDGPPLDSIPVFLAQQDGPFLVAYAVANPDEGYQIFQQYLDLHGTNPYLYYRNASLWLLIDSILRHPDPDWTIRALKALFIIAFNTEGMAYEETLELVLLGLQARAGQSDARQKLEERRIDALKSALKLDEARYHSDTWGVHKRRLSALALAFHLLPDGQDTAKKLLTRAIELPRGFAGFMYSAWLNLAENIRICGLEANYSVPDALQNALATAQNIQDSVFCARATAQVNAMIQRWWPLPDNPDLEDVVKKFSKQPSAEEFTSLHFIGETFQHREDDPDKLPLQPALVQGNTLRLLAEAFRLPLADFIAVNPGHNWEPDTILDPGTPVNIPDPEFASLLAARLSAEVAVADWLYADEKRALIQSLTLAAVHHRTVMDTILSRLFLAAVPDDLSLLDRLMPLARQIYAQFPDIAASGENPTLIEQAISTVNGQVLQITSQPITGQTSEVQQEVQKVKGVITGAKIEGIPEQTHDIDAHDEGTG